MGKMAGTAAQFSCARITGSIAGAAQRRDPNARVRTSS
jgi:hypothetical protein